MSTAHPSSAGHHAHTRPQRGGSRRIAGALAVFLVGLSGASYGQATWTAQGPAPSNFGQVEGITDLPVVGAVHTVVAHPSNGSILWIGTVNGGIWKTTSATAASPTWSPLTDDQSSLSIGALELDPTDGTNNTLVAGIGLFSSFSRTGGARAGLLRTTDGGTSWSPLASLAGLNISGIAPRGATMVASVDFADAFNCPNVGIWRSTDTGASFTKVGGSLPNGVAFDLASDPTDNTRLYTGMVYADFCSTAANGIYRSDDTGATWSKVSDATIDALLVNSDFVSNIEIAVGNSGQVYAGVIVSGQLAGLFRSGNAGASWTQLDTPSTNEGGSDVGIHPSPPSLGDEGRVEPGGQGATHFSIRADPSNANLVYVGGDRQPSSGGSPTFPNSIGANDYSGRLFRVDASLGAGSQATALTHNPSTNGNSAPHADSREMVFDANGNLIEVDDGGIYRRTSPSGTGDWFSLNGNLQSTEQHDIAYDTISDILISGNQDTGTTQQPTTGTTTWESIHTGDGGDVAVDAVTLAGSSQSARYSSFQNLGSFRRLVWDASNSFVSGAFPALAVLAGGDPVTPNFVTPVVLNAVDPSRLVIGANNAVYESLDQGATITQLSGPGVTTFGQDAIAYGGKSGGIDNLGVLYVGTGETVYVRTAAAGALTLSTAYTGGTVRDIALDPDDWNTAFAVDATNVYRTSNAGTSWTDVTGTPFDASLRSVVVVPGSPDLVVVGGAGGVYQMDASGSGSWQALGAGLPGAPVFELVYDPTDDILVAGTLGRGAWLLSDPSGASDLIFMDGFESGNTLSWSATVP